TGQVLTFTYESNLSPRPAKFTLVWTDYPAAVEAGVQLVNDLDLEVIAPDGHTYFGNVFSEGWSTTGGASDRVNNVECVYLPASLLGTYVVRVKGYNVPMGPQTFALLVDLPPAPSYKASLPLVMRGYTFPTPTPRPTIPSPTPGPSPTPTMAPGEFRDDFGTITGTWPVTATSAYEMGYQEGRYRLRVYYAEGGQRAVALPALAQGGSLSLRVEGQPASASLLAYGLVFNYTQTTGEGGTYLAFIVSSTGYYALVRSDNLALVDWTPSSAIATEGMNVLEVRREGEQVRCLVNGEQVISRQGPEFTGGDRFGLVVFAFEAPYAEVLFDNFAMVPLGGSTSAARLGPISLRGGALPFSLRLSGETFGGAP
ncbi:MAG: hypothetical protein J7M05_00370, partial [Anaerolineae bacterium]|nr:hypothetical protein [Anaerolineae bacterium]